MSPIESTSGDSKTLEEIQMALKKTVEFKGLTVTDAYNRVSALTILPGNTRMEFGVFAMANPESAPFFSFSEEAEYDIEGDNPIKQAYEHLKALDRFQGAEDC
jgi:hypothetical protein